MLMATYQSKRLDEVVIHDSVAFKSPTLSWELACDKDIKDKAIYKQLLQEKSDYFSLLDKIFSCPGFKEFFIESGGNVSLLEVRKNFDKFLSTLIEKLGCKSYLFFKQYDLSGDMFFDSTLNYNYSIKLNGKNLDFAVSQTNITYPDKFGDKLCWWNWADDNRYFVASFFNYLIYDLGLGINSELYRVWMERAGCYSCFEQSLDEENEGFDVGNNVWSYLCQTGFFKVYKIWTDYECGMWSAFSKPDGTIDMCLFDEDGFCAAFNDSNQAITLRKRMVLVLKSEIAQSENKYYFLLNGEGKPYVSVTPGKFGGHKKLKIYGMLDCPSAKRYIKQGKYENHRVFFANEEDAVNAGYRPCAICMPEKYEEWKGTIHST